MKEIWKDIPGYENLYQASNLGRIKNLITNNVSKGSKLGFYKVVSLKKDNKQKMHKVHRLIALTFIPNPNNLPCINHINEIKTDNRIDNLEWCNQKYNTNYKDTQKRKGLLQSKAVCQYDKQGNLISTYISEKEAMIKTKATHICSCCKGKRKTSGGYIWKFKEEL